MRHEGPSGAQIAFLSFAVALLAVPLSGYIGEIHGGSDAEKNLIGRVLPFLIGAGILFSFPSLRRLVVTDLTRPISGSRRIEVMVVAIAKIPLAVAASGGLALWIWLTEGNAVLDHRMRHSEIEQLAYAFSREGLVLHFLLGALIAPVMEELVFRGFLYRAWERRWGWIPSTLLVSTLFGLYHPHFVSAFLGSVVYVCVLRRTGTLQAPILVHAFSNAMLWHPFAGQFLVPRAESAIGDISSWGLQLACLVFAVIAVPMYVLMARKPG